MVNWFDITARIFKDSYTTVSISNTVAHKFKGDFSGLLLRELNVPESQILQNTIINGLNSSSDYDSSFTDIKILSNDRISPYL